MTEEAECLQTARYYRHVTLPLFGTNTYPPSGNTLSYTRPLTIPFDNPDKKSDIKPVESDNSPPP